MYTNKDSNLLSKNLGHSCHVECIEQALQGWLPVFSSFEGTRVESLVWGELNAVDSLQGLSAVVSAGVVQWVGCTGQVPWGT